MNLKITRETSLHKLSHEIIDLDVDFNQKLDPRETVRGICLKGSKILVVYAKKEKLYGTPGGGVEPGELKTDSLRRELLEEVGAKEVNIVEYLGTVSEIRNSFVYKDTTFNPVHHYYLVDIPKFGKQELIEYEAALDLTCAFIDINEAIASNEKILENSLHDHSPFYRFQTETFKIIKELFHL